MARKLVLKLGEKEYAFDVVKLDRSKLYGWKEVKAFDPEGNECIRTDLDETGTFFIPKGGKAMALADSAGRWINRSELKAVLPDGSEAQLLESSYSAPVELGKSVSQEEFLNCSIDYVYMLSAEETQEELLAAVSANDGIYTFDYRYRSDYSGSAAFILESKGNLFLLTGKLMNFEFIGLEEVADVEPEGEETDDDELDFDMF
ncbi:hypothetical protein KKF34_13955 [Myxococcota bacterium]|nr:hypothetical protein [Myxococcota bacterium]MBU1382678.1 hypothetical protein [Myxococcota bacterium]MBU1497976.1 hypothetical protein [Myxococcota bacterium]